MPRIDLDRDKMNLAGLSTSDDKQKFLSLGVNSDSKIITVRDFKTAREYEKEFKDSGLFTHLVDHIPGGEFIRTGLEDIGVGVGEVYAAEKMGYPSLALMGAAKISGGIVELGIGLGIAGFAGYHAAKDYFSDNLGSKRDSTFHLTDPKNLNLTRSMNGSNTDGALHLMGSRNPVGDYHFLGPSSNLNDFQRSANDYMQKPMLERSGGNIKGFDESHESNVGSLADRSLGERPTPESFRA
jgi:hypothetical protein